MNEQLRQLYANLCAQLGDLEYKKSQIDLQIEQLRKDIYGVNATETLLAKSTPTQQPQNEQ